MARKTNKTDHVLNLLSSGGKKTSQKKDDNDTPPVDLNPKKPTSQEAAPDEDQQNEGQQADSSVEAASGQPEAGGEQSTEMEAVSSKEMAGIQQGEPAKSDQMKADAQTIAVPSAETPIISVVHTSGEENPIADAVKNSLEAELDAYMEQKSQHQQQEPVKEEPAKPVEKTEKSINVSELLGAAEKEAALHQEAEAAKGADIGEGINAETTPAPESRPQTAGEETAAAPAAETPDATGSSNVPNAQDVSEPPVAEVQAAETQAAGSEPEAEATSAKKVSDLTADIADEPAPAVAASHQETAAAEADVGEDIDAETVFAPESKPQAAGEETAAASAAETPDVPDSQDVSEPPAAEVQAAATQTAGSEPEAEAASAADTPALAEEKDYMTLNVMEHLVRDQVPKYVRQFGHCDCDRCIEDTIALALTHLPSKYVVIDKHAASPMLSFYEKRYAGQLIVEITKATMIVNESPKH